MFHRRETSQSLKHLHERVLQLVYNDYRISSFEELLQRYNRQCVHHININIESLAIDL